LVRKDLGARRVGATQGCSAKTEVWESRCHAFLLPLHRWFRLKLNSNTKYRSDALTRKKTWFWQSIQANCNLLSNGLKTSTRWQSYDKCKQSDEAWSTQIPLPMTQTVITQPRYGTIHEITCHIFIYTAPGGKRKNWNEKSKSSSNVTCAKCVPTTPLGSSPLMLLLNRPCVSQSLSISVPASGTLFKQVLSVRSLKSGRAYSLLRLGSLKYQVA